MRDHWVPFVNLSKNENKDEDVKFVNYVDKAKEAEQTGTIKNLTVTVTVWPNHTTLNGICCFNP